jgi:transcriptional regulator with XRE-family HTH domain
MNVQKARSQDDQKLLEAFGRRFAQVRKEKSVTQQELAHKTDLHVVAIGYIETGKRWPRISTLNKLARGMGVTLEELFRGL